MSKQLALYARVSKDRHVEEGTIASQLASLHAYVDEQGHELDADLIFTDDGFSGATLARPGLDALRDHAMRGTIDYIVVLTPDRLARNHAHQLVLIEEFKRVGVEIMFVNRPIAQTPEDQLLLQMQGVIAEFEREKIMERSRRGKLYKAKQGCVSVLSGAPYGYVYMAAGDSGEARYEIHPQEADIVRRVFKLYVDEGLSIGAIVRALTADHVPTRRGAPQWERSVVWGMLRNPAYTGQAAYRKTQAVPRQRATKQAHDHSYYPKQVHSSARPRPRDEWLCIAVPRIISPNRFERAARRLEANKKHSPRNNTRYPYLLSGLLRCQSCGYALYGKPASSSKAKRCYYRCIGQDGHRSPQGRVCEGHPIRVDVLDELVWEQTKQLIQYPEVVFEEYSRRIHSKRKGELDLPAMMMKKKKEVHTQELEKKRLLDLYQTGIISLEEITPRLDRIRNRIKDIEQEYTLLEEEKHREQKQLQLIEQFSTFQDKFSSRLGELPFDEKKQVVRLLVEEVLVDSVNEKLTVKHVIPLDKSFPLRSGST
ncbi:MAG: recombinase family protein, partial [Candidatus Binatia bacterium]